MKTQLIAIPRWMLISLLIAAGLLALFLFPRVSMSGEIGKGDFIGYWSATYLVGHGQNPYDLAGMGDFQHQQMQTGREETIMAWNPPTLFVLLLPLAWLSFDTARSIWLIINLIVTLAAGQMLASLYLPGASRKFMLACILFAVAFPQVISALFMGQVTLLVLLGMVSCMFLIRRGQWFGAGMALILVTIKPQMIVLAMLYLLLYMARERHLEGWLGLTAAGVGCMTVLFLLRPAWIQDLIGEMSIAPVHWVTPTIGGLLSHLGITEVGRWAILLFLPLPFLLLWNSEKISMETAVALLTLITVPTTFFGWSFDQVILLIPIVQIFAWVHLTGAKKAAAWTLIATAVSLVLNYYQRMLGVNDVYYLWIPLFWWVIFAAAWFLLRPRAQPDAGAAGMIRA